METSQAEGATALTRAALDGDLAALQARNKLGRTPVHEAVKKESVDALTELLKQGANVDAKDDDEETALMKAIDSGQRHLIELLLNAGANANAVQEDGWMPIHCAASFGHVQTIKLLLDRGASVVSLTKDRRSVLSCAASSGSESAIEFLARERPRDINNSDEKGWAPIHYAASKGDAASLKLLIDLGADTLAVTKTGESPLFIAARMGRIHTANVMVGREGQHVNAVELEHGRSMLHVAAQSGNVDMLELLIGLGADLNAADKDGVSVLQSAAAAGHAAVTMKLFQAGADAKKMHEGTGWTTFLFAASGGNVELLQLLLEEGEDASAVATDGKTALHVACLKGKREAVTYLLGIGVDANALDKNGRTALHYASQAEGGGCVSSLLDSSVDVAVSLPDKDGYLPLHLSAAEIVLEETTILLEAGANVHALTNTGEAALQLAIFASHYSNVPLLAEAGSDSARVLCTFGSRWTTKCEEKLMAMEAAVDVSEVDTEDELRDQLQWCMAMRACVLHWEKQQRGGARELLNVPVEAILRGETSVMAYIAGATGSNA